MLPAIVIHGSRVSLNLLQEEAKQIELILMKTSFITVTGLLLCTFAFCLFS